MLFCITGCAGITTVLPDGRETTRSREEFERYVESVFRRQNKASLESGQLLSEEIDSQKSAELESAERYMLRSCSALNQVVQENMDRKDPGILLEIKVRDTIGACDFATQIVEELIVELE